MDYVQRLSYVMSMGRPAASGCAVYSVEFDVAGRFGLRHRVCVDRADAGGAADRLRHHQHQTRWPTDLKAGPGYLETMSGNQYRTVIIPSAEVLSQTELDRLKALVKGGGKVLFLGRTPSLISRRRSWMPARRRRQTSPLRRWRPRRSFRRHRLLRQRRQPRLPAPQVVPAAIETALNNVIGTREVALDAPDTALKVMTRRLKDADVYLFFNEGAQASAHSVTLKARARRWRHGTRRPGRSRPWPRRRARARSR